MRTILSSVICLLAVSFLGCKPAATDADVKKMCENLSVVRGEAEIPIPAELTADVEEDFATKEKNLLAWKAKDMRGWDEELDARLAAMDAGDEAVDEDGAPLSKSGLKKRYAQKKEIGAKQFDADLSALAAAKKKALAEVAAIVKEAESAFNAKIQSCIDEAKKESVSQSLAQCRIAAPDKDTYWNKCK